MTDKLRRWAEDTDTTFQPSTGSAASPGKSTLTSRHVMRKQRDDNGVAADANVAVDRAASSSGAPLPADLRGRFESSLGTDLSSVRVHTGAASAQANDAVGARAYATGQDIHFGAGQYNPASAAGQHLIAHEVAHTVQQQGSAPTRQHKLEVSTAGDAHEVEADRAADSMVAGRRATLGNASSVFGRGVNRKAKLEDQIVDDANDAEKNVKPPTDAVMKVSTVGDIEHGNQILGEVQDCTKALTAGMANSDGAITAEHLAANAVAAGKLDLYLGSAGSQQSTLGNFQANFERLNTDYLRLSTQIDAVYAAAQSGSPRDKAADAALHDKKKMNSKYEAAAQAPGTGATMAANKGFADATRIKMMETAGKIATAEAGCSPKQARLTAAVASLRAVKARLAAEDDQGGIDAIKGKIDAASQKAEVVGSVIKTATKVGMAAVAGPLAAKDVVTDSVALGVDIAKYAIKQQYTDELNALKSTLTAHKALKNASEVTAAAAALDAAMGEFILAGNIYLKEVLLFDELKKLYREEMSTFGQSSDKATGGSGEYAIAAEWLAEADVFMAQMSVTLDIESNHDQVADVATKNHDQAAGIPYYGTYDWYSLGEARKGPKPYAVHLLRGVDDNKDVSSDSAMGKNHGANDIVKAKKEELQEMKTDIGLFQKQIASIFVQAGSGPAK